MEKLLIFLFWFFVLLSSWYLYLVYRINNRLKKYEYKIVQLFNKRTNLIPSLFDVTKKYITKHNDVFFQIMKFRKQNFSNYEENDFLQIIKNELDIHNELNFIFRLTNSNPKIQLNGKFLLIRDLFIDYSSSIWEEISNYKRLVNLYNLIIWFKDLSIIWYFLKLEKKNNL